MDLINWIIMLAIAWIAVAFFCWRERADWSIENRVRRRAGSRLIAQAVFAIWSAALIVVRGFAFTSVQRMPETTPHALLIVAALLAVCGGYWLIRGVKLLKARRLFTAW
ncbi:hypothetical protein [Paraburkholderia rhizosphaerae]|uniref:Uncharacterized protein n=1 Tax=Paraburkholderia rhizosphaerae TaxID=480658 RepID=A0A4R8LI58_9BURK|nr:hypothetical protein [Paraburkholderia rhizosphaerae]TDY42976.1 hypothetical protein BX592_11993 [Paraburkholderia rhizosphaerae]